MDVAGLQFCNLELKSGPFFSIFFKSFVDTIQDKSWHDDLLRKAPAEAANVVADLFSMMTEVYTNELHIPNVLAKITTFTATMYGGENIQADKPYDDAVASFVKQFVAVMAPLPLKDANKALEAFVHDRSLLKEKLAALVDYDKTSKVIRVKTDLADKLRKTKVDADLLWINSKEDSKYREMLQEKFPDADIFEVNDCSSMLNKRLQAAMFDEQTLTLALEIIAKLDAVKDWSHLARAFLKFLILVLSSFDKGADSEKFLKDFLNHKLEKILMSLEKKQSLEGLIAVAREKIDLIRKKYISDSHGHKIAAKPQLHQTTEEDKKAYIKKLYEKKKDAIMAKMVKRKQNFMKDLDMTSDKLVQSISKTENEAECPITSERLSNEKLYFMLGQLHQFNVIFPH